VKQSGKSNQQASEKPKVELGATDYERIGRVLEAVVTTGYAKRRRLVAANFLRGLFFGLGASLGVSIVLALLLWTLTIFSDLPFIGQIFEKVEQKIEEVRTQQ
jgi:hypothetical protein